MGMAKYSSAGRLCKIVFFCLAVVLAIILLTASVWELLREAELSAEFTEFQLSICHQKFTITVTSPNRNYTQFQSKRVGIPSSITCKLFYCFSVSNRERFLALLLSNDSSRRESSMPSNDDHKPSIDADWRSFRAKLVAAEKSRPKEPTSASSPVDLHTLVDQPNPITVGDKWAHTIHKSEKGCLLLAIEKLGGVHIFERTIIWVLSTGPLGPSGIILNRPSLMSIKENRSTSLDVAGTFSDRPLFFGGPSEEALFLVRPKGGDDAVGRSGVFDEVMKGLYYGTKEGVGCAAEIVKRDMVGLGQFRFFDGYCSPSVIDLRSAGSVGLWDKVLELMGRRKVR